METIYLIKYKKTNTIQGYIKKPEDFIKWLWKDNKRNRTDKEIIERENEFEVMLINRLLIK